MDFSFILVIGLINLMITRRLVRDETSRGAAGVMRRMNRKGDAR